MTCLGDRWRQWHIVCMNLYFIFNNSFFRFPIIHRQWNHRLDHAREWHLFGCTANISWYWLGRWIDFEVNAFLNRTPFKRIPLQLHHKPLVTLQNKQFTWSTHTYIHTIWTSKLCIYDCLCVVCFENNVNSKIIILHFSGIALHRLQAENSSSCSKWYRQLYMRFDDCTSSKRLCSRYLW